MRAMELGPQHEIVLRAASLKQTAVKLKVDADRVWGALEALPEGQRSNADARAKFARLQELRMTLSATSSEFIDIVRKHPQVAIWLDRTPICTAPKANVRASRRASRFSAVTLDDVTNVYEDMGGRMVMVQTHSPLLGELECILLESEGKQVAPDQFSSTGLVICLQGLPFSRETVGEWCASTQLARWLDLGVTVAVPNLQASSALNAEDLSVAIQAVQEFVDADCCLLVGKDMMALRIVEIAQQGLCQVVGTVLVGPSSPVPEGVSDLPTPLMVLWAVDDEISAFDDCEEWEDELSGGFSAILKTAPTGGHRLDNILKENNLAEDVKNFSVACFLMTDLLEDSDSESWDGIEDHEPNNNNAPLTGAALRIESLTAALPGTLKTACQEDIKLKHEKGQTDSAGDAAPTGKQRASILLASWIQGGMSTTTE